MCKGIQPDQKKTMALLFRSWLEIRRKTVDISENGLKANQLLFGICKNVNHLLSKGLIIVRAFFSLVEAATLSEIVLPLFLANFTFSHQVTIQIYINISKLVNNTNQRPCINREFTVINPEANYPGQDDFQSKICTNIENILLSKSDFNCLLLYYVFPFPFL